MEQHGAEPANADERAAFGRMAKHEPPLLPLPDAEDMPIVVLARLSLSFPVLLSAVPLWTILWSPQTRETDTVRCWFSDGGITSNFPIHFFDSPLPRWPTFGINLGPGRSLDPDDQAKNIWAPRTNQGGTQARWGEIGTLPQFGRAIADTMQNWMDNAQVRLPGYRDRVVEIRHTTAEGGMNLNMDKTVISNLAERGMFAGELLRKRFSTQPSSNEGDTLSWENHRWLRYRSMMPLVESLLTGFVRGCDWPPAPNTPVPNRTYSDLIVTGLQDGRGYKWRNQEQQQAAADLTSRLVDLGRAWGNLPDPLPGNLPPVDLSPLLPYEPWDPSKPLVCDAPRPRPAIRVVRDF